MGRHTSLALCPPAAVVRFSAFRRRQEQPFQTNRFVARRVALSSAGWVISLHDY